MQGWPFYAERSLTTKSVGGCGRHHRLRGRLSMPSGDYRVITLPDRPDVPIVKPRFEDEEEPAYDVWTLSRGAALCSTLLIVIVVQILMWLEHTPRPPPSPPPPPDPPPPGSPGCAWEPAAP